MTAIADGTITSPQGFLAGAASGGIKNPQAPRKDVGILFSKAPCVAAAVVTRNKVKAAPIIVSSEHVADGRAQAIVANSGCANACTGPEGEEEARKMAAIAAHKLGLASVDVLVASTGVIGVRLPMDRLSSGIEAVELSRQGGHDLAYAIMTTDTRPKETAVSFAASGRTAIVGGIAKGAGMIHPNMATMLSFIATDAAIQPVYLADSLRRAVDISFNMVTIDGDTSTNDCVFLLANGLVGNEPIAAGSPAAVEWEEALTRVCQHLAKEIARDGEGATKLIEVQVRGAVDVAQARSAARTIAGSNLTKTAVYGSDPNWGRVLAALGRSDAEMVESKVELHLGYLCMMREGRPLAFSEVEARALLDKPEVTFRVDLHLGSAEATAWGCDLTEEYVRVNSVYTT
ncbi:MAG: bifunctional glutamate N-acetyltransferase/amino-acid acetyltransferase ArgJ [Chloroflexi bacterium]|nr:bifunctional glutamate N-acetyltransferase/amino-acid acetyltransferase ArgJ [Chloroflexota bacterium]